jgi:hypothetical protein
LGWPSACKAASAAARLDAALARVHDDAALAGQFETQLAVAPLRVVDHQDAVLAQAGEEDVGLDEGSDGHSQRHTLTESSLPVTQRSAM